MDRYLDQWARINRWHRKVNTFYEGERSVLEDNERLDMVRTFFIECFHLKDWIKADFPNLSVATERIFDRVEGEECFKICADLANASKHVDLNKAVRKDKETKIGTQGITIMVDPIKWDSDPKDYLPPVCKYRWDIIASRKKFDVKELADECIESWKKFMRKNGLSIEIVARLSIPIDGTSFDAKAS
ncbi:MAG: hypothetical protein WDN10_04170 [bacterium]